MAWRGIASSTTPTSRGGHSRSASWTRTSTTALGMGRLWAWTPSSAPSLPYSNKYVIKHPYHTIGEWLVALKEAAAKCTPADKALQVIANNDLFLPSWERFSTPLWEDPSGTRKTNQHGRPCSPGGSFVRAPYPRKQHLGSKPQRSASGATAPNHPPSTPCTQRRSKGGSAPRSP